VPQFARGGDEEGGLIFGDRPDCSDISGIRTPPSRSGCHFEDRSFTRSAEGEEDFRFEISDLRPEAEEGEEDFRFEISNFRAGERE
jgi:hypothetical protein